MVVDPGPTLEPAIAILRRRLPTFKAAVKAMARYLAVLIYRLLTKGEAWADRGTEQFKRRRAEWNWRA